MTPEKEILSDLVNETIIQVYKFCFYHIPGKCSVTCDVVIIRKSKVKSLVICENLLSYTIVLYALTRKIIYL